MSEQFEILDEKHIDFLKYQKIFFVASAASDGHINVSPKGMDTFRVINQSKVIWLNYTGSGNETAAHVLEDGRMTIMFCSFEKQATILRLYGKAKVIHPKDPTWDKLYSHFQEHVGARQIFELDLSLVQISCGYVVPEMEFKRERKVLKNWAEKQGKDKIEKYWKERNQTSIDGKNTGI